MTDVIPRAYLDDLSGRKFVVQIPASKNYMILIPPDYRIDSALVGSWVLDSAVHQHGYIPFEETRPIISNKALSEITIDESLSE